MTHVNRRASCAGIFVEGDRRQTLFAGRIVAKRSRCWRHSLRFLVRCASLRFPFCKGFMSGMGVTTSTFLGISQDDAKRHRGVPRTIRESWFPIALRTKKRRAIPASNAYGLTNVPTILPDRWRWNSRISSMGFVKNDLEQIAAQLAERRRSLPRRCFARMRVGSRESPWLRVKKVGRVGPKANRKIQLG